MNPLLYEINTRCWLHELSHRLGQNITLATVPDEEFSRWKELGFTHVWLMGVWTTGPRARQLAISEPSLRHTYDEVLPGWTEDDIAGSPYSIADYRVPETLGGEAGLASFRERLHRIGLKLILDFVPNHLGCDHPWLSTKPDLFVQSPKEVEGTFAQKTSSGVRWIAHGKDPYFPYWTDVAQLDYRKVITRAAIQEVILSVAARCDGVRCDMAMLLLNDVILRTWGHFPFSGTMPRTEFWQEAIPAVKRAYPDFLFMAEVYWGLEAHLQWLGFDYTYDKQLYDDLIWRHTTAVQQRLLASPQEYVASSVHFLENHDEARIAGALSLVEHRAAALIVLSVPGMTLLHDGQLTGARLKVPVQLGRRPDEPIRTDVQQMYNALLAALARTSVGRGQGEVLIPRAAWPGNPTGQNFVLVQWQAQPPDFDLVVVNLAPHRSQCFAPVKIAGVEAHRWSIEDFLSAETYERNGSDLAKRGFYLNVREHAAQLFHFTPMK